MAGEESPKSIEERGQDVVAMRTGQLRDVVLGFNAYQEQTKRLVKRTSKTRRSFVTACGMTGSVPGAELTPPEGYSLDRYQWVTPDLQLGVPLVHGQPPPRVVDNMEEDDDDL